MWVMETAYNNYTKEQCQEFSLTLCAQKASGKNMTDCRNNPAENFL